MTDVDKVTGLPALPKNMRWRVGGYGNRDCPSVILEQKSSLVSGWETVGFDFMYESDLHYVSWSEVNAEMILKTAEKIYKDRLAEQAGKKFIGTYPPMRLR